MIAQEELLHQHTNEMAAQVAEVAAQMEFEQPPVQEHINVHLEHDDHSHDHHIEMKEGHACSADCPEHGNHSHDHEDHHHEAGHEKEPTITQKTAEHACGADCPEHSHSHHKEHEHDHQDAKEQQPKHDHHIESKAHVWHGGKYTHEAEHHHEHDSHKDHRIEQKTHVCGADCPEHGHTHAAAEHDHHEHRIETKSHEHKCSPDCPEHGHAPAQHEHEQQSTTREAEHHTYHETAEAPKQARAEHAPVDTAPYRKIEEVVRQAQLAETEERIIAQRVDSPQSEAIQVHEAATRAKLIDVVADQALRHELQSLTVVSENEPVAQDALLTPELVQHREATYLETAPDTPLPLTESATEQTEAVDPLANLEAVTLAVVDLGEMTNDTLSEPLKFDEAAPTLDADSPEAVIATTDQAETFDEIELAETIEPLEMMGIEPAVLPLPEAMQAQEPLLIEVDLNDETAEPLHMQATEAVIALRGEADSERAVVSVEKTVETLAEAISLRIDEVEEQIVAAAPERAQEIRKTLNILSHLQAMPAHERNLEVMQKQFIHLLRLLGYENPAETLAAYIHQYGIGFTDELLARLLELMGQGRSFESLPAHTLSTFAAQQTKGVTALGVLVLALFKLKGHLLPSSPSAAQGI